MDVLARKRHFRRGLPGAAALLACALGFFPVVLPAAAWAQEVSISQNLRFGRFALRAGNSAGASITVTPQGNLVQPIHSAFLLIEDNAQNGVIELRDFPAFTQLSLDIIFTQPVLLPCACPGPGFMLNNFTVSAVNVSTNEDGDAWVNFGGTLTADGGVYGDHAYSGTVDVTVEVDMN